MSCNVLFHAGSARHPVVGPIQGTWDYKWNRGYQIRYAFQRPPGLDTPAKLEDYAVAKQLIAALAHTWNQTAGISFRAADIPDFDPPQIVDGAVHPQRRSPVAASATKGYDILVSLEELPLTVADLLTGSSSNVVLPFSELGRYALRADCGAPTMFLGPTVDVGKAGAPFPTLEDYYKDPRVKAMVVHEFGHALGLAHEHQSPKARAARSLTSASYDIARAKAVLRKRLLLRNPSGIDDTFVTGHLVVAWPGNLRFSDWRPYAQDQSIDSVMSVPYHECIINECACCRQDGSCADDNDVCATHQAALVDRPTARDIEALTVMYA